MFHSTRVRPGMPLAVAAVAAALVLAPVAAFADDGTPPEGPPAAASEPAAEPAPAPAPEPAPAPAPDPAPAPAAESEPASAPAAEPAPAPAPPEVVVVDADETTAEDVLAESPEEPTVTLFAAEVSEATDAGEDAEVAPAAAPAPGDPCYPAVCIDNGTILLAVNPTGELNTPNGAGSLAGPGDAGLEYLPTGNDSTSPGCLCEGWGVGDPASGVWGGGNVADYGSGGYNLTLESFTHTASTATSVVTIADGESAPVFRVTHEYVPAPETPNLYQVNVTIENLSGETIATVQYRRVMDWDVEPTAFDEYVTIDRGTASAITYTSDDGFASSNPLSGPSSILFEGNAVDSGPDDHGALFDFSFGSLAPGGKLSFIIYYGGAADEATATAALAAVGAEAYSFGQTSTDPVTGTPNTFIFAFGKVGGAPIFARPEVSVPNEPAPAAPAAAPAAVVAAAPAQPVAARLAVTGGSSHTTGVALGGALLALLLGGGAVIAGRARRVS